MAIEKVFVVVCTIVALLGKLEFQFRFISLVLCHWSPLKKFFSKKQNPSPLPAGEGVRRLTDG